MDYMKLYNCLKYLKLDKCIQIIGIQKEYCY